jgi:hypothetical protein
MVSRSYVHVLSAESAPLREFFDDIEASFLALNVAPDLSRPTDLPVAAARDWARARPAETTADSWLPYLSPELLDAVLTEDVTTLRYAGVAGMAVVERVLRETTEPDPAVVLQSHTYTQTPLDYTVYRYDEATGEYGPVARGEYV